VGITNGDFENALTGWTVIDDGCDAQSWTHDANPADAHTGSGSARGTARHRLQGTINWCGTLRQTLAGLTPGDPNHDIAGFWRSSQLDGFLGGSVTLKIDGTEIGRFETLQGAYAAFAFPFTPAGPTAVLDFACAGPGSGIHWREYFFDDLVLGTPALPSKARLIRQALIAEIKTAAGIGSVTQSFKLWNSETLFPAVYVFLDREEKIRNPTRSKECEAFYVASCVLKTANPEDAFDELKAEIENKIEDDPTLGGLCMDTWVSGCGRFIYEETATEQIYKRNIRIEAKYRHVRAAA
jgi:hypothetical protein